MDAFDFLIKVLNHDFEKFLVWMGWQFLKDIKCENHMAL